ncbi:MAG TPA: cbb3-type cytochrome c oxidase subunit II [Methylomirabilota bacterium]|nr:cbb3-type cytochrome c oxidase subunit II [Methylomirabilota bacterium]
MSNTPLIFLGVLAAFLWSWVTMVYAPYRDFSKIQPAVYPQTGEVFPNKRPGYASQGREIYQEEGCATCHTLQNRSPQIANDSKRGWGNRHTVIQDFAFDPQPPIGSVRIGPDLANIGVRRTDRQWHLLHLYNPKLTVENSTMPQYPYLFETRQIRGGGSTNALKLTGSLAPAAGHEVVPTQRAQLLVSYLLSLKANAPIYEAPPAPEKKAGNATNNPAATNAAGTNAGAATNQNAQ